MLAKVEEGVRARLGTPVHAAAVAKAGARTYAVVKPPTAQGRASRSAKVKTI